MNPQLKKSIDDLLNDEGEIVITAYSFLDHTEDILQYVLSTTLLKFGKIELYDPVFSSLKELTTNAIKANIKRILIDEGKIENPNNPLSVVSVVKSVLNERSLLEYGIKCWERKLSIRIHISLVNNNLVVKVIDPQPLSDETSARMHKKIERAKEYESLAMCYLENPDPLAEGMGLGLSMVVVLLKGSDISPENFIITSDPEKNKTTASISISL